MVYVANYDIYWSMTDFPAARCRNVSPEEIADCVFAVFNALPPKFKPRPRPQGKQEWIPLSGIVLSSDSQPLSCVSLAYDIPISEVPRGVEAHAFTGLA